MATLTVNFVGTDHFKTECYNLMVVVHSLVDALDVSEQGVVGPIGPAQNLKMLFDGPNTYGVGMQKVRLAIHKVTDKLPPGSTLNMVGHSRGLVNAIMLASELLHRNGPPLTINIFGLDAVKMIPEGEFSGGDAFGRTVFSNTSEFFHFVAEDDSLEVFNPALLVFRASGTHPTVEEHSIPGTHGTGSQCNYRTGLMQQLGDPEVPFPDAAQMHRMWPIGRTVLLTCLNKLAGWGTPLTAQANTLMVSGGADRQLTLLKSYWDIIVMHPWLGSPDIHAGREVNDSQQSSPTYKQTLKTAKAKPQGDRIPVLQNRARNIFRNTNVFVNEHHFALFRNLSPVLADRMRTLARSTFKNLIDGSTRESERATLEDAARAVGRVDPLALITFDRAGFKIGNTPMAAFR